MENSIIYNRKDSVPVFIFEIEEEDDLAKTYGIVATDVALEEGETSFTTTTVGGDIYIYCTGQKPVTISLSGCILNSGKGTDVECYSNNKEFRKFYEEHRIGKKGNKPVRMTIGGDVFTGCLLGYSRKASSVPTDSDVFSFKFVGVKND